MSIKICDLNIPAQQQLLFKIVRRLNTLDDGETFGPEGWWHLLFDEVLTLEDQ